MRVREAEAYASKASAEVHGREPVEGHDWCGDSYGDWWRNETGSSAGIGSCAGTRRHDARLPASGGKQRSAGVDGLTVSELKPWLQAHWAKIRQALLAGEYMPSSGAQGGDTEAARRGTHPGHSLRTGSPNPTGTSSDIATSVRCRFSASSYGFRPGRNAHQAVNSARGYVAKGRRWTVDLDLEKFFDRVNHDVLMSRVGREVKDPGCRTDPSLSGSGTDGRRGSECTE